MFSSALFIGRFQPFHLGHLSVIDQALKKVDYLIIGIGSAEDSFLPDNPFTCSERLQMIKAALDEAKISPTKYCLIPIRNINNYPLWCHHVALLTPPFQSVYTGSPLVKSLFLQEKKYEVKDVTKIINISATEIRKSILNSHNWKKFVPKAVATKITEFKGEERLKTIHSSLLPHS